MIKEKTLEEFRSTGLLLVVNQLLHLFGWAIIVDLDNDRMYPARVRFRGFDNKTTSEAYTKVSEYMLANAAKLLEESKE